MCKTIRETGFSRHHGGSIKGPPDTLRTSLQHGTDSLKGLHTYEKLQFDFKNVYRTSRSEKTEIFLLGIIGDKMRAALETLGTIIAAMYRGLMGSPNYTRK